MSPRCLVLRAILWLAVVSCQKERAKTTYDGLPAGVTEAACAWGRWNTNEGDCRAGGRRWSCVREDKEDEKFRWEHVSCIPYDLPGARLELDVK